MDLDGILDALNQANPLKGSSGWIQDQTKEGGLLGDQAGTKDRAEQAEGAGAFADYTSSEAARLGIEADRQRKYMEDIARGRESVSAMQLQDSLGKNLAAQQSMVASANPASGAMAARSGMMNQSRAAGGLAGQQALAGIQERQSAQQALQEMLLRQRGQDINAATQNRGIAAGAFVPSGAATGNDKIGGLISGGLKLFGAG